MCNSFHPAENGFVLAGPYNNCPHNFQGNEHSPVKLCLHCNATIPNPDYLTIEEAEAAAGGAFCD